MALSVVQTGVATFWLNGAITAPTQAFTDATDASFSASLIANNPNITVRQAGAGSTDLVTLISAFVSASAVTLDSAAGTTQASTAWAWGVGTTGTNGTTTLQLTLPQAIQRGDLFAVFVQFDPPLSIVSITDSIGSNYIRATTATQSGVTMSGYYAKDMAPAAGGFNTLTLTMSGAMASGSTEVAIVHVRGADTSNPLDVADTNTAASGTALASHAYSTKFLNEIIIAYTGASHPITAGQAGYTVGLLDPFSEVYEYNIVKSLLPAGTTTVATQSTTGVWLISTMSFKAGGFPLRGRMQPLGL